MDLVVLLIGVLIALCDGLGALCLGAAWALAWPFRRLARGCFALAERLTFGLLR